MEIPGIVLQPHMLGLVHVVLRPGMGGYCPIHVHVRVCQFKEHAVWDCGCTVGV